MTAIFATGNACNSHEKMPVVMCQGHTSPTTNATFISLSATKRKVRTRSEEVLAFSTAFAAAWNERCVETLSLDSLSTGNVQAANVMLTFIISEKVSFTSLTGSSKGTAKTRIGRGMSVSELSRMQQSHLSHLGHLVVCRCGGRWQRN